MNIGKITLGQPYLNFLLSLADLSKAKRILLLTGIIDLSALPLDVREKVKTVSIDEKPNIALKGLDESFDLTIMVPTFGRVSRENLELPGDWQLSDLTTAHAEDNWLAWSINATRQDGQIIFLTSRGMLNSTLRQPIRQRTVGSGLVAVISLGATHRPETSVNSAILVIRRKYKPQELTLVDVSQIPDDTDWIELGNKLRKLELNSDIPGLWAVKVPIEALTENFRLDPDFHHPRFMQLDPPPGYTEVLLSDIADIRGGRSLSSFDISTTETIESSGLPFVQVSNITSSGELSLEFAKTFPPSLKSNSQSGWAEPGDILITTAGTLGKVCLVSEKYSDGLFYDTSIRRIRVNQEVVLPRVVYDFMKSEAAQLQISRYSSGSVIPIVSTPDLGNIRVFLPPTASTTTYQQPLIIPQTEQFTNSIAKTLQEKVVNPLLAIDTNRNPNWRNETVESLREIMRQIQVDHEPLDELVTRSYPLPIAIAFRRLTRAYHNPYEQVNRLTELYEALTQFFYYVLVSDFLRNPGLHRNLQTETSIKQYAKAYKSFSMDNRLKFIRELLNKARQNQYTVFVPELLQLDIYTPLNELRNQRNMSAHSAAGTAAAQKALFEKDWPYILGLLEKLRFLKNYPLCRVDSYYNKGTRTLFRIEYFQGALYETDYREQEAPITDEGQVKLIGADATHVILLNPEFGWLDLHPFYQVMTPLKKGIKSHKKRGIIA
ncbi:MAG TPA: restriction endonuclease subunit S, partial [Anaerolineae bacterium]|nr:restriction endonuclease subunit S [Anaerolineae bacterium]